jgi:LacI family transcriptional regulator
MDLITQKEIARICGVSTSTISNILNGKKKVSEATRQKVLEVVRQTGYHPNYFAQGMRKQKTNIVGIISEDLVQFSSPPIIERIMAYCEDMNYRTILINMRMYDKWKSTWYNDDEKLLSVLRPAIRELLSIKVDGIIYVAGHSRVISCFPDDFEIPVIIVYTYTTSAKFPSVVIDDEKGGYDMTRYLISMGHRKIGVIAGVADNLHTQKRSEGYMKALSEEKLPYDPALIRYGDWKRPSGYREVEHLIKQGVTAIFCMNDDMAAGVYDYLYDHGLVVGEDISVAGYDNMEISRYLKPALTTNEIPFSEIGTKSAELMVSLLTQGNDDVEIRGTIKMPCRIIPRNSVKMI